MHASFCRRFQVCIIDYTLLVHSPLTLVDVTEEIFRIGTTSSASILLDAVDHLEKKSPKADDDIQFIRPNLPEAVNACIRAAGHEFDIHWQKQLLKAASFGKSVLELYNSDEFVEMCETLRVLNAVRFYEVGFGITFEQFVLEYTFDDRTLTLRKA